jgi:serine/threonine-protein kinase
MEKLDIDVGDEGDATFFFTAKDAQVTTVTEGMVNVRLYELGDLPTNSRLSGRLIFGERVYGRFTRARSPDGKINIPVCLEIEATSGGRGLPDKGERGPNTAQVLSSFDVRAVKEFE